MIYIQQRARNVENKPRVPAFVVPWFWTSAFCAYCATLLDTCSLDLKLSLFYVASQLPLERSAFDLNSSYLPIAQSP